MKKIDWLIMSGVLLPEQHDKQNIIVFNKLNDPSVVESRFFSFPVLDQEDWVA